MRSSRACSPQEARLTAHGQGAQLCSAGAARPSSRTGNRRTGALDGGALGVDDAAGELLSVEGHHEHDAQGELVAAIELEQGLDPAGGARDEESRVEVAEVLPQGNPSTRLSWTIALEAGKPTSVEYVYTLFVRS